MTTAHEENQPFATSIAPWLTVGSAAGAAVGYPVGEGHGWRIGRIKDPFGHDWEIGRRL